MDRSIMRRILCLMALLQLANGNPVNQPPPSEVNQENVPPAQPAMGENVQNNSLPQQALIIVVAAPCVPEQPFVNMAKSTDGNAAPIAIIPIDLRKLILRNLILQALSQQAPHDENLQYDAKQTDLLSNGFFGSLVGGGSVSGTSASDLYGGGSLLGGGALGSGLVGSLLGSGSASGTGLLGLIPFNLGGSGSTSGLGVFNLGLGSGSTSGVGISSSLLSSLTSGSNPISDFISTLNLSGTGPGLGTGLFGTNLFSGLGLSGTSVTNPITTLLSNIGMTPGVISGSPNSGGLFGFLGGLGMPGGGIPAGSTGLLGLLSNLGIGNTGTTSSTGVLGLLTNLLNGTPLKKTAAMNFRRIYSRTLEAKEEVSEMPWLVSILVDGVTVADGVLISDRHILTAATPLISASDSSVLVTIGRKDRCSEDPKAFNMTISRILKNPLYDPETKAHDLSLLQLSSKVSVTPQLLPICLPSMLTPYIVYEATVASFAEAPESAAGPSCRRRQALLPLQPLTACSSVISPASLVTEDKTCLGVHGAKENMCAAEPGTAVQYRAKDGSYELIGIISHAKVCGSSNSTLFVRVHDHLPWILETIHEDKLCIKI